ncbi:MAG: ABC transporter ATP-binding protein [Nitrospirae bacterium]|nr:ABC transporter ATP-binding protein [Nitrospirota bacterium]
MNLDLRLKKSFKGFHIDVSLAVNEDLLVLFGPSGAGKTLILKMISGIVSPDEGVVMLGNETVFESAKQINIPVRNRRIGHLFQDYALFPHMTVYRNIAYGISHLGHPIIQNKVNELIEVMRLSGLENRYPQELSGGQRQRCALARTLATEPRLLLLDEPFSALDFQVREKLRADLLRIHSIYPVSTILVTHDLEEAFMLGKNIAVLNNGHIEQAGPREDVFYRPQTRNVARFIGTRNIFDGTVTESDGSHVTIRNQDIGLLKTFVTGGRTFEKGQDVSICIRPEEVIVIRPGKPLDSNVQDNIIEGEITSMTGKGSTQIIFLRIGSGETFLKIELPNFVVRKLLLGKGKSIRVALKKESLWVIP